MTALPSVGQEGDERELSGWWPNLSSNNQEEHAHSDNTPTNSTAKSFLGKRRAWNKLKKFEWLFLGIVTITLTVVAAIKSYRLCTLPVTTSEFTLAILLLFNICFCYFYTYHGVLFEQPYEICSLVLSSLIILVYSVLDLITGIIDDNVKIVYIVFMSISALIILILGARIGYIYKCCKYLVFKIVGADQQMQAICCQAQLHCVLLLFDAQASYSCILLIMNAVGIDVEEEWLVLILGTIFTIIWILIGYLAVRFENLKSVVIFLILCIVQPPYVIWRFAMHTDHMKMSICYVSGVYFLFIHCYLIYNTIKVYRNFGKGLKEQIFDIQPQLTTSTSQDGALTFRSEDIKI